MEMLDKEVDEDGHEKARSWAGHISPMGRNLRVSNTEYSLLKREIITSTIQPEFIPAAIDGDTPNPNTT